MHTVNANHDSHLGQVINQIQIQIQIRMQIRIPIKTKLKSNSKSNFKLGSVRFVWVWCGLIGFGLVWVWLDSFWFGLGLVWLGWVGWGSGSGSRKHAQRRHKYGIRTPRNSAPWRHEMQHQGAGF